MSDESEEKTEAGSQQKINKEREKGKTMQAADTIAAVVVALVMAYVAFSIFRMVGQMSDLFDFVLEGLSVPDDATKQRSIVLFSNLVWSAFIVTLGLSAVTVVVTTIIIQRGFVFSTEPIMPDFSRLNPVQTFMSLFKIRAMSELGIGLVRIAIWTTITVIILYYTSADLLGAIQLDLAGLMIFGVRYIVIFLICAAIFLGFVTMTDLPLQKFLFADDMKMTKTDVKRENRDSQGDPQLTRDRKGRMKDMVNNPVGLAKSTFLAFGPNGVVGIHYVHGETPAPVLTLRHKGASAHAVRQQATLLGIPVVAGADLVDVMAQGIAVGEMLSNSAAVQPFSAAYMLAIRG